MTKQKKYCSKVLLFGEYSVIRNSMALAIPYPLFDGELKFNRGSNKKFDQELRALSQYLKRLEQQNKLDFSIDVHSLAFDVGQGLYFNSTIPQGYGVGSSGALCAAIVDRYGEVDSNKGEDVSRLRTIFAQVESHFHGSSSGFDPLVSYLNRAILINTENEVILLDTPPKEKGKGALFLLNTGRARRTEPLVNLFLEKCKDSNFNKLCDEKLIPITNNCIISFLEKDMNLLYDNFGDLSQFQFSHFKPMIPQLFQELWKNGLESEAYFLKLCGAGGGGFILGITKNFKEASQILNSYEIRPLIQF